MASAVPSLQTGEAFGLDPFHAQVARSMRDLFRPLENLLVCGGDPRLALDPVSRQNEYGCGPVPVADQFSLASSTASVISERGYARASRAREELMRAAISHGLEEAFDARLESMREELRSVLGLSADVGIVFAPSGTDAQLLALFVARTRLGPLTTVLVGSDQTGSGATHTARGRHFNVLTAAGCAVRKDDPIDGLACNAITVPLMDERGGALDEAEVDAAVLDAVERAAADGGGVLLQVMDSSKLGWRAPSEACLAELARRWPGRLQIVVDACQMRLGRSRLDQYLDRGDVVLITGSKYFGGPAFAGALLVPASLSRGLVRRSIDVPPGLAAYTSRSDWPRAYAGLRNRFESRANLGPWLRWEAAMAETTAYYEVPAAFRNHALRELGRGIESLIALSPSLAALAPSSRFATAEDEEFCHPTIFPFTIRGRRGRLGLAACRALCRALNRDMSGAIASGSGDAELASRRYLIGQPVKLGKLETEAGAALRLCIGARLVTDAWSADLAEARSKLDHTLDRIAGVIGKIELLLASPCAELREHLT